MSSKYTDVSAIVQVIGCLLKKPTIFDETENYIIHEEDFPEQFHKIIVGAIYNIHLKDSEVSIDSIIDYLNNRPKYYATFESNKGTEYLTEASNLANLDTFNYYYNRLKKFSLLRAYDNYGIDVSFFYDPMNVINVKKKQEQEDKLDNSSLAEIADIIDNKLSEIRTKYVEDDLGAGYQAGEGMVELIESLRERPEIGIPLYGSLVNTITRGARLRKLYLRSGHTGVGKTRALIADACYFACNEIYSSSYGWIKNGQSEPTLFIATEQDKGEVQTMMLAFVSNVDEQHILDGRYLEGEYERVLRAAQIMQNSSIWVEELPDFSLQDVENKIKKNIREHNTKYVVFDYIHTSMKILEEITRRAGGVRLREDNILFMLSTRLKDLANKYGVFIMSSTQLNGEYMASETPDQNLLRGAKSIADKIDVGMILLSVNETDLEKLKGILEANPQFEIPNIKLSVYKCRRGAYKGVYVWCKANLGTCRIEPMFVTTWRHEIVGIEDIKIIVDDKETAPWE